MNDLVKQMMEKAQGIPSRQKRIGYMEAIMDVLDFPAAKQEPAWKTREKRWAAGQAKKIHWTQTAQGKEFMRKKAMRQWQNGTWGNSKTPKYLNDSKNAQRASQSLTRVK